jgi:hypothetical protein
MLISCKKDYYINILGIDLYPIEDYEVGNKETRFLKSDLQFTTDFLLNRTMVDYGHPVKHMIWNNMVDENTFYFYCDQDLYLDQDTVFKNQNLIGYFEYKRFAQDFSLRYSFKNKQKFKNQDGYYKFYFKTILTDNTALIDSCIVKIQF